ncbi:tetratricopeptide repeat protein [Bacillus megaterium]|nr:tetratricopeptide repeat protein [Priestia megaterium]
MPSATKIEQNGYFQLEAIFTNYLNLGVILYEKGQVEHADSMFEKAITILNKMIENGQLYDTNYLALSKMNIAILEFEKGNLEKSTSLIRDALDIQFELVQNKKLLLLKDLAQNFTQL